MNSHADGGMDGPQFAKLSKELVRELAKRYNLLPIDSATSDLVFAKVRGTSHLRRIDFNQFILALETIGRKMSASVDRVTETICSIHSTKLVLRSLSASKPPVSGPASLYYGAVTTSWIKTSREAVKPVNHSKGLELSEIVSREKRDKLPGHRRQSTFSTAPDRVGHSSPASTIREGVRLRSHERPLSGNKENYSAGRTPPPSDEFYKKVVSNKFLSPVDGYFEGFLQQQ